MGVAGGYGFLYHSYVQFAFMNHIWRRENDVAKEMGKSSSSLHA
jgi:hypothetical protein